MYIHGGPMSPKQSGVRKRTRHARKAPKVMREVYRVREAKQAIKACRKENNV